MSYVGLVIDHFDVIEQLTKPSFETLEAVVSAAAAGSELVFDYIEPGAFAPDAPARIRFGLQRVRQLGEPMISGLDPATLDSELASVGLRLVEDVGPSSIQVRFLEGADGFHESNTVIWRALS